MKIPYQLPDYFDTHPTPMVLYDVRNLSIAEANKSACKLLGYSKRSFSSKAINQLLTDVDAKLLKSTPTKVKKKKGVVILTKPGQIYSDLYLYQISAKYNHFVLIEFHPTREERKELDQQVPEYNYQFKKAVEGSSIVSIADVKGNISFVNENFIRISGYSERELIGKNHHLINSGYHPKSFWIDMWKTIARGKSWRAEVKNKAKDGSYYWVDTFVMPLVNEKGVISEYLSIRNDITRRKKEEENNKLIAERLSETMHFARMGTVELNLATNILEFSSELLELLQVDSASPRTMLLNDFLNQYIVKEDISIINEKLSSGIAQIESGSQDFLVNVEFRIVTAKRQLLYIDAQGRFRKNGVVLGILHDITHKRLAEKAMLVKAKQIEMMLGGITDGFFATDAQLNFSMVSPVFAKMAGMTPEDMQGKNMLELFPFMKGGKLVNLYLNALKTQKSVQFEHKSNLGAGQVFLIHVYPNPEGLFIYYRDVSVSKQAELELINANELFKRLSANVPGMIYNFYLTPENQPIFPYVSSGCIDLFGIESEKLLENGELFFDVIHPKDLENVKGSIVRAYQSKAPWAYEFRIVSHDGSVRWIEGNSNPYMETDGSSYWYGFMQDITQRKTDEIRIAESELKNRLIIENSGEGILFTDSLGVVLSANPEACRIFRMTEMEIREAGRNGLVADDPEYLEKLLKQREENQFYKGELLMKRGDGSIFPAEIASRLFVDPSGELRASIILRDISERKKADQIRDEILHRFEKITSHLPGFIFQYITKANGESFFPYVSSGIRDIYNLNKEDVMRSASKLFEATHPEDLPYVLDSLRNSAKNLSVWSCEYRVISNGITKWLGVYASPDRLVDGSTQWYGYLADVTSRRATELELRESQNRLRQFFDSKLDATILLDHNYTILDYNKRAIDSSNTIFRNTPEKGVSIIDCLLSEILDIFYSNFEMAQIGIERETEFEFVSSKHEISWWTLRHLPIFNTEGKVIGVSFMVTNITEKKKLALEVNKLALIASRTSNAVILTDIYGRITWVNEGFERMTEYSRDEVLGKKPGAFLQGEETDKETIEKMRAGLVNEKGFKAEILNYSKSGRKYWLDVEVLPIRSGSGELTGYMAVESDISNLKNAIQEMQRSEQALQTFMDHAPLIAFMKDLKGRYTFYNKAYHDFISERELKPGFTDYDIFDKTFSDACRKRDEFVSITGEMLQFEHQVNADTFLEYKFPLKDVHGRVVSIGGISINITEKLEAQRNLKKIYDELNAILNASTEATFLLDANFKIQVFNKSARIVIEKVYGKSVQIGDSILDFAPPSLVSELKDNFARALSGEVIFVEREIAFTEEIAYWNQVRYLPVYGSNGNIVGVSFNASDISERKKIEQALFQSQQYFESLVNSQSSFLIRTDLLGRYTFANRMYCEKFGLSPGALIGMSSFDTILEEDHGAYQSVLQKCLESPGQVFPVTLRKPNPFGGFYWTEWEIVALQDENENPVSIQFVGLDATERMRSKVELEKVNNRLMLATYSAEMGIWEWNFENDSITWDKQQYRIFGVNENQTIDFPFFLKLIYEEDRESISETLNQCVKNNENFDALFRIRRLSDGKIRYVKAFGSIELNSARERMRMVGVNYDVSDQEISNQVIRESEERFRSMAENIPGAIFQYILYPDGSDAVSFMSVGCSNLWEISAEEAMANSRLLWDMIHPDDIQEVFASVRASAHTMQQWQGQWRIITPSKKTKWLEARGMPKTQTDKSVMWYTVVLDITNRKLAEEELVKSKGEYQQLVQMIPVGVYKNKKLTNQSSKLLYVSKRWCDLHGLSEEQVLNDTSLILDNIHPEDLASFNKVGEEAIQNETDFVWEGRIIINNDVRYLHIESKPESLLNGEIIWNGIEYDITERKIAEIELIKANRLYAVTSQINQMVLHAKTKDEVFEEVCNIAIEYGKFRMAWIGLIDNKNSVINPVSSKGYTDNYFDTMPSISLKNSFERNQPTGLAAISGCPKIDNEISNVANSSYDLWRNESLKRDYFSGIGLPIIINGLVKGVLTLYKDEINFFTDKEIALLQEVTSNIAFAVQTIDAEIDRKRKEVALLESEERFRSMVRDLTIGVLLQGPNAEILSSNKAGLELLGLSEDELIGTTSYDSDWALVKENGDPYLPEELPVPLAIQKKEPIKGKIMGVMRPTKGVRIWLMVDVIPRMDEFGNVINVIATLNNITELKEAEQLMIESRERIKVISDNLPSVAIYQYELLEGENEGRYIYFSSGIEKITGLMAEELLEDPMLFDKYIHPDDQERNRNIIQEVNAKLSVFDIEYRFQQHNGTLRWFRRRSNPSRVADGRILWNGVIIDITDQKQTELQLIDTLREKDLLIKEIHHRVKNNLQLISSIIFIKVAGMQASESRSFLENMRQRIRSVALIHERLLQTGSINQVNIASYLNKLIQDLQVSMVRQDQNIEVYAQVESIEISLDQAIHCGLIVNELVVNAFKHAFTDRDGGKIEVNFKKSEGLCTLLVRDNGISLPTHIQPGLSGSFGMELLEIFIKQLKADITIQRDDGTVFIITFTVDV